MSHLQSDLTAAPAIPDLRVCLRPPIPEIADAAGLLNDAVTAHIDGRFSDAESLIEQANMSAIRDWARSLVGKNSEYNTPRFLSGSTVLTEQRDPLRKPSSESERILHVRFGYHCCFCGTPIFRKQVRTRLVDSYPKVISRSQKEADRHPAIYVMKAQYDHVVPHSRGGRNDIENLVVTCVPCNFGRNKFTLEEMGLFDPRTRQPVECTVPDWDGLERLLISRSAPRLGSSTASGRKDGN
jgi:5-methylcytosine-specific restriction endonuclease McrA